MRQPGQPPKRLFESSCLTATATESGVMRETQRTRRLRVEVRGVVQGVGFRPFIHWLARDLALAGWVNKSPRGGQIEGEGVPKLLSAFLHRVEREAPAHSSIEGLETRWLDPSGSLGFEIRASTSRGEPTALIPPDIAICEECVREVFDPANRRHGHPFANCSHCGPRFSIIENLPYDRAQTSMKMFSLCAACLAEYEDPSDRRFHAQPIACPSCGPQLALWDRSGSVLETRNAALGAAAQALREGRIIAVKGLGGFHLMVDADNPDVVARLRNLKLREEKPLAVMLPNVDAAREICEVGSVEEQILCSPEAPILLLRRICRAGGRTGVSRMERVAPGNPYLGVMLPTAALHHLLLREVGTPLVATSGNLRDEPICIDEHKARERLGGIADLFLVHDRPIVRPVDDSVVRVVAGREMVLRRARGFAPLPVTLRAPSEECGNILAVGGHLKNTIALSVGTHVFISQHIGDLETVDALEAHHRIIGDIQRLHHRQADVVAADAHPGYASSRSAGSLGRPVVQVQHHFAHLLSCLAENGLEPPVMGVVWDGTGDGLDGTIWGGEFLMARGSGFVREGWMRTFPLPGGDAAIREPRRAALGLLHELFGEDLWEMKNLPTIQAFTGPELIVLRSALERGVNTPRTSSVGRLFDAVASLAGLRQISRYEGQAAMELEFAADTGLAIPAEQSGGYTLAWKENDASDRAGKNSAEFVADWGGMVHSILNDLRGGVGVPVVARFFHDALAGCIVPAAARIGLERVALSGGCFQNRILSEMTIDRLSDAGFRPCWHRRVPPNDGGLALGQVVAAMQAAS